MNNNPVLQPLALIGGIFSLTLLFCSCLSVPALCLTGFILILLTLTGGFFCIFRKTGIRILLLLLTAAAAFGISFVQRYQLLDTAGYAGSAVYTEAKILSVRQGNSSAGYLLSVKKGDLPAGTRILIYTGSVPEYEPGQVISLHAAVSEQPPTRSQLARGGDLVGFSSPGEMRLLREAGCMQQALSRLKENIRYHFLRFYSKEPAGFLTSLYTGDRSELSLSLKQAFSVLGLSHILCISGLHIGILTQLCLTVFSRFFGRGKLAFCLTLLISGGFVIFTGAGASSVRAWIMSVFILSAFALCRDYVPLNALGGAMLFLCLVNPRTVLSTGFWLSVLSCFALFTAAPKVSSLICEKYRIKNYPLQKLIQAVCVTVFVNLCCLPAYFLWFGSIPWNSILPNLLLIPLMPFILGASLTVMFPIPGRGLLARGLDFLLLGLFHILKKIGEFSGSIPLLTDFLPVWLIGTFLLILMVSGRKSKTRQKILAASLSVFLLAAGCLGEHLTSQDTLAVSRLQMGSSGSTVISYQGRAVLIGCGSSRLMGEKTASFLTASGIRTLDAVLVPSNSKRCSGGVFPLLQNFPAQAVFSTGYGRWQQPVEDFTEIPIRPLSSGSYKLWKDSNISVIRSGKYPVILMDWRGIRLRFQSHTQPVPESGWNQVIFYDEIRSKDRNSALWYDIIKERKLPVQPEWFRGRQLFGEYFAPERRFTFTGREDF